jgi:hypothetical protein
MIELVAILTVLLIGLLFIVGKVSSGTDLNL